MPRVSVTDREIEAYYASTPTSSSRSEVCASHVLVKVKASPDAKDGHPEAEAKAMAEKVLAEARGGADFAELAPEVLGGHGLRAERAATSGCFGRGRMVPEFDKAAFSLEPGQISELVKTSFGYHVIRLGSARRKARSPSPGSRSASGRWSRWRRCETLAGRRRKPSRSSSAKGRKLEEAAKEAGAHGAEDARRSAGASRPRPSPRPPWRRAPSR